MLHVLLLILKIIGWILLGIIGLLLLLVMLILFCPIRYQADISYQGGKTLQAKAKVRYLILSVWVLYDQSREKDKLKQEIRLLWFRLGKKKAEEAEALRKAQEEEKKAKEELQKLKDAMTLKTGDTITVKGVTYRVTNAEAKTAEAYGVVNKNQKQIEVAATVKIKGNTCKVTAIADQAFAGMKKATKAVIGKNVSKIGKKAFYGDSRLKSITVKGKKLKTVGKQALKGINKKAVIRIPKSKKKAYRKLFKGKGQKKSVIVK